MHYVFSDQFFSSRMLVSSFPVAMVTEPPQSKAGVQRMHLVSPVLLGPGVAPQRHRGPGGQVKVTVTEAPRTKTGNRSLKTRRGHARVWPTGRAGKTRCCASLMSHAAASHLIHSQHGGSAGLTRATAEKSPWLTEKLGGSVSPA